MIQIVEFFEELAEFENGQIKSLIWESKVIPTLCRKADSFYESDSNSFGKSPEVYEFFIWTHLGEIQRDMIFDYQNEKYRAIDAYQNIIAEERYDRFFAILLKDPKILKKGGSK